MTRRTLDVGLAVLLAACASAPVGNQAYVAPTGDTITSETEQGRGDRPTNTIYVTNRSTVPIIVWGVQLMRCQNVNVSCEPRTVNIRVNAGGRSMVMRVGQANPQLSWTYGFHFSWRADTSGRIAAVKALAEAGDENAQARLAAIQRSDSLRKLGPGYRDLTPPEFDAIKDRVAMIRAEPESLVLAPGERVNIDIVRILMVDGQGNLLGRIRMVSFRMAPQRIAQFLPSAGGITVAGVRPGRASVTYALSDQAIARIAKPMNEIELPVIVRYVVDEHAPVFAGTLTDSATKVPLRCAKVVLEDSLKNEVNEARSDATGAFSLRTPHTGTYHIRVELNGWTPFNAPNEVGAADEKKTTAYAVRFGEQILAFRPPMMMDPDNERASLTGAASPSTAPGAPPGQNMRLAGSATLPIIEIISARIPASSSWVQFAVDDVGKLDTASVVLPAGTAANARAAVMRALPQLRFSAARENGKPACELVRLTLTFTPR